MGDWGLVTKLRGGREGVGQEPHSAIGPVCPKSRLPFRAPFFSRWQRSTRVVRWEFQLFSCSSPWRFCQRPMQEGKLWFCSIMQTPKIPIRSSSTRWRVSLGDWRRAQRDNTQLVQYIVFPKQFDSRKVSDEVQVMFGCSKMVTLCTKFDFILKNWRVYAPFSFGCTHQRLPLLSSPILR